MSKQLILFPFGGNAREALVSIQLLNELKFTWDVLGFIDDDLVKKGRDLMGVRVLGDRSVLHDFPDAFLLAVPGNPDIYRARKEIIAKLNFTADRFATVIAPSAIISKDAQIGHNVLIMPNVVISTGCRIGNHCLILPNTVISHESVIGDYTCVGANVAVSGGVCIEEECYIGSSSNIREKIKIGKGTLLGLGSNVVSDIPGDSVAFGNPAKVSAKAKR